VACDDSNFPHAPVKVIVTWKVCFRRDHGRCSACPSQIGGPPWIKESVPWKVLRFSPRFVSTVLVSLEPVRPAFPQPSQIIPALTLPPQLLFLYPKNGPFRPPTSHRNLPRLSSYRSTSPPLFVVSPVPRVVRVSKRADTETPPIVQPYSRVAEGIGGSDF